MFADANSIYSPAIVAGPQFADHLVCDRTDCLARIRLGPVSAECSTCSKTCCERVRQIGITQGVDGGIDAIRCALSMPRRTSFQILFFLLVLEQGRRVVHEPDAVVYEPAL